MHYFRKTQILLLKPIALILVVACFGFIAAETPLEKLLKNLAKITESYPQEKVHIQTDKPYYAIGEDIFLKAYVVTAAKNEPSLLSAVLYIDLINEKNQVRQKITVALEKGIGNGSIPLADSLVAGRYRLRAYTNYMRNYDADLFYEKFISIGNVLDEKIADKKASKDLDFDLQFFPEGGALVKGIRSKVGVKAVSEDGNGRNLSGYIIDSKKEKVALFTTEHAGMGAFAFTPLAGEKYSAVVTLDGGKSKSFYLPDANNSGYVLSVNQVGDNIKIGIGCSTDLVGEGALNVVAQANGKVYASFSAKTDKKLLAAVMPKKNFPTGIVQFTLFTADNKPVAERLIFINHNDALNIDIKEQAPNAGPKEKTTLAFSVKDVEGMPVDGNFSVSITDAGLMTMEEDNETTILSNLLLTSDLRGYIEQPNYYFNNTNPDKLRQLDNLLLTQGWRRFKWADIAAGKEPDITFRPEQSLEISGKITNLYGKPLPKAKVVLLSNSPGIPLILDTLSDAKGNFVFDMLDISDSTRFTVQAKGLKDGKDVKIIINERPGVTSRTYFGNSIDLFAYLEKTKEQFKELDKQHMLRGGILIKEVKIVAQKPFTRASLLNVKGSANAMGTVDKLVPKKLLEEAINFATIVNRYPQINSGAKIFLDGNDIPKQMNAEIIKSLSVRDIEGIEILTAQYNVSIYGEKGPVIFITTKKGNGNTVQGMPFARLNNRGFSAIKEFYMPLYDNPSTDKGRVDLRSTIFWQPDLITNKDGKAVLSYFNAGNPSTYRVTIEGMDAYGNIGRKVFNYEVK